MYAIFETGGKQYKASKGDVVHVEKLDAQEGKSVSFDALVVADGDDIQIGTPTVKGAKVKAKVVEHGKEKKVVVFKYKPKRKYRKKQGHRQPFTKIKITSIDLDGKTADTSEAAAKPAAAKSETAAKKTTTAAKSTAAKKTTTAAKSTAAKKTTTAAKSTTAKKTTTAAKSTTAKKTTTAAKSTTAKKTTTAAKSTTAKKATTAKTTAKKTEANKEEK